MKFSTPIFIVGVLAIGLVSNTLTHSLNEQAEVKGIIDGLINSTINKLLQSVPDPIAIDKLALNFTQDALKGEANISGLHLYGLKSLVASKIDVSILSLAMNTTIQIPSIIFDTSYFADIVLAKLLPLYGSGKLDFSLDNIELLVSGKVNITKGLSISNATISLGLGGANFDLHGLLNNDDLSALINEVLNDTLAPFINDNRKAISDLISPIASLLINALLKGNKNATELVELERAIQTLQLQ